MSEDFHNNKPDNIKPEEATHSEVEGMMNSYTQTLAKAVSEMNDMEVLSKELMQEMKTKLDLMLSTVNYKMMPTVQRYKRVMGGPQLQKKIQPKVGYGN